MTSSKFFGGPSFGSGVFFPHEGTYCAFRKYQICLPIRD